MEPALIPAIQFSDMVVKDAASQKLTLVGLFSVMRLPSVPLIVPMFNVIPQISNLVTKDTKIPILVTVSDPTDKECVRAEISLDNQTGFRDPNMIAEIPIMINGLKIHSFGNWRVTVFVGREKIGERVLPVIKIQKG